MNLAFDLVYFVGCLTIVPLCLTAKRPVTKVISWVLVFIPNIRTLPSAVKGATRNGKSLWEVGFDSLQLEQPNWRRWMGRFLVARSGLVIPAGI